MLEIAVTIAVLILFVVAIAIVQNNKEKIKAEQRLFVSKQRKIIQETEDVLVPHTEIPMRNELKSILQQRIINAISNIISTGIDVNIYKRKLINARSDLALIDEHFSVNDPMSEMVLQHNEQSILTSMRKIKEIRHILHCEHRKGLVEHSLYSQENRTLSLMQTKLAVEAFYNRAINAKNNDMLGSARQAFEKTLAILERQIYNDSYIVARTASINAHIEDIQNTILEKNKANVVCQIKKEKTKSDIDILFGPKKKWH